MKQLEKTIRTLSLAEYLKPLEELSVKELHNVLSKGLMTLAYKGVKSAREKEKSGRNAYYFSAEFLVGRAIYNNINALGVLDEVNEILSSIGKDISYFEEIEDAALGNGGLGRLAACFLDSAATLKLPLIGYGIRYKYGLFKQSFEEGLQQESPDDWLKFSDPWSIRRSDEAVRVDFSDGAVLAVPYDMPIIGFGGSYATNLRLWQAEALNPFSFNLFNSQKYDKAVSLKNRAEDISRVLYPNDSGKSGKMLRLRQQYFFSSASLKDIIRKIKREGKDLKNFDEYAVIQLNDTHPVIAIPELIRLLSLEGFSLNDGLEIANKVFCYTNHTVMKEALECWELSLIRKINPEVAAIITKINTKLRAELKRNKVTSEETEDMLIVSGGVVRMANLAVYCSKAVNGVAKIHTEILKTDVLNEWYKLMPEKFSNKTNGITFRRWACVCNKPLSDLITTTLGSDKWLINPQMLKGLEKYAYDNSKIDALISVKAKNKQALREYINKKENKDFNPDWIVDVQIKRLHEYKRQLLNALCILELYFEIKEGKLTDFTPTVFIFGAKAAPSYYRAKAIIKLIHEIARLIDADPIVSKYMKVIFVTDYNVSYAEKIIAGAEVSEQLSTAGTEASGTGNMKLMLNGAVTLGTYDGANIEIVEAAGQDNNYIFGYRVEDIAENKDTYSPREIYSNDNRIKRCLDALVDGTLDDGDNLMFSELYDALLNGATWHKADHYYLLGDFADCLDKKLKVNRDYKNKTAFYRKCLMNIANAGRFSSDRTIKEYANEIWHIK